MNAVATADVRGWSKVDFASLGYPAGGSPDPLDVLVTRADDYVAYVTGRPLDSTMPASLVTTAQEAVQLRVEQKAMQTQEDYVETGSDDQVTSFTAGSYTEQRSPEGTRVTRGGGVVGYPLVNPWPALNQLLWILMTDDMQAYWRGILGISSIPYWEGTEVDWSSYGSGSGQQSWTRFDDPGGR